MTKRKWLQKHRDEVVKELGEKVTALQLESANLHHRVNNQEVLIAARTAERDEAREALAKLQLHNAAITAQAEQQTAKLGSLSKDHEALGKERQTYTNCIRRALEMEGQIWTQPVMTGAPPFRPLSERRTPIVSVLNLKGGVGKTTLTAYLGWALATRGYRVLLVDLDLQGSLSSLFIPNDELKPAVA